MHVQSLFLMKFEKFFNSPFFLSGITLTIQFRTFVPVCSANEEQFIFNWLVYTVYEVIKSVFTLQ